MNAPTSAAALQKPTIVMLVVNDLEPSKTHIQELRRQRFDPKLIEALHHAGHVVEVVGPYENMMGHAGMLVLHPSGVIEMAGDPRSDGQAVGF